MKKAWILAAFVLAGCASKEDYLGRDISYIQLDWGNPETVVSLPDGRTAYRFVHRRESTRHYSAPAELGPYAPSTSRTSVKECPWIFYTEPGSTIVTQVDMPDISCR